MTARQRSAARVREFLKKLKAKNKAVAAERARDSLVRKLAAQGYGYEDIIDELYDEGYDEDDVAEAFAESHTLQDELREALHNQAIDYDELQERAYEYADFLDIDVSEVYDLYFDYDEE